MAITWEAGKPIQHEDLVIEAFDDICQMLMFAVSWIGQVVPGTRVICERSPRSLVLQWEGKDWPILRLDYVPEDAERQEHIHLYSRLVGKKEPLKAMILPSTPKSFVLQSPGVFKEIAYADVRDSLLVPALFDVS